MEKEQGRSLIETLGVLALIGILSIAAIAGYQYALDKYKCNETWIELEQRVIACNLQMMKNPTILTLDEFENTTKIGYPITQSILDDTHFEIVLSQVPTGVCRQLLKSKSTDFHTVYVNDELVLNTDTCIEQNKMTFEFETDLGQGSTPVERCKTNADCTRSCDSCQNGICKSNCSNGMKCTRSIRDYERYECCNPEKILNGTCCTDVKTEDDGQKMCCTIYGKCCPTDHFDPYLASQSQCLPCDDPGDYIVRHPNGSSIDYNSCFACPNRVVNGWTCSLKCKPKTHLDPSRHCLCDNNSMQDAAGNCYTCDEATAEKYLWNWKDSQGCINCNYRPKDGYCTKCPHGTVAKGVNNASECVACPDDISELPSKNQCLSCDGTWNEGKGLCEK